MTAPAWSIWVEGKEDEALIELLAGQVASLDAEIKRIGGGVNHLRHVATKIRRRADAGRRVALVTVHVTVGQRRSAASSSSKSSW